MPFIIRTVCGVAGTVDDGFTACVCSACAIGHGLPIAEASSLGAAVPPPKWWQQIRRYELCRNAARPRGTCLRYSLLSCHVVAHGWKWLAPAAEPSPVVMWRWSFNRRATKAAANGGARCFELCSCTALWGHTPRPLLARDSKLCGSSWCSSTAGPSAQVISRWAHNMRSTGSAGMGRSMRAHRVAFLGMREITHTCDGSRSGDSCACLHGV